MSTRVTRRIAFMMALALFAQLCAPPLALAGAPPQGSSPSQPSSPNGGQDSSQNPSDQDGQVQRDTDPADLHRGDFILRRQDVVLPGRGLSVDLTFTYRSRSAYNGPVGYGWDMSYNRRLRKLATNNVVLLRGTNRTDEFTYTAGTYTAPAGVYDALAQNPDGTAVLTSPHGDKEFYNAAGSLVRIEDRHGNAITLTYDPAGPRDITGTSDYFVNQATGVIFKDDRLLQITDTTGRTIDFAYTPEGRLETITYLGRTIRYGYDPNGSGDLVSVTTPATSEYPQGHTTTYAYTTHNLISITDPKGQTYLTNAYDSRDCLRQQTYGPGASMIAYASSSSCPAQDGTANPGYRLTLDSLTASPGATVTVSWSVPSATFSDQIRLYPHDVPTTSPAVAVFSVATASTGSNTFTVPQTAAAGLYEARYVLAGTNTAAATSNTVTVAAAPLPPPTTEVTDRKGFRTRYTFDTEGHITTMEQFTDGNPPGEPPVYVTTHEYDAAGNRTRTVLPRGNELRMAYDGKGSLTELRRKPLPGSVAADVVTAFTYEPRFNLLKTLTDPRGNLTTYTYDYELGGPSHGNLRRIIAPQVDGQTPVTTFTHNSAGQVETVTDPNSAVTRYEYEPSTGYLAKLTAGDGSAEAARTTFGYDAVGNVTALTTPNGATTRFLYNDLNQLTTTIAPSPFLYETRYRYDANGNLAQADRQATTTLPGPPPALGTTNPADDWQSTVYTYTLLDQLASITDDLGHTTAFTYDRNGNRDTLTDAAGHVTASAYDERDLLQTVTDAATPPGVTTNAYDANGNLATLTDANGHPTTYAYDDFDRLTHTTYADASHEDYTYDAASNLISLRTPNAALRTFTYDALNRLRQKVTPEETTTYTYDPGSRLLTAADADAALSYAYDALNRVVTAVTDPTAGAWPTSTVRYGYDRAGNRTVLAAPAANLSLMTRYDALNRLTNITQRGASQPIASFAYDALSRRTSLLLENGTRATSTYDAANRLLRLEHTSGPPLLRVSRAPAALPRLRQLVRALAAWWLPEAQAKPPSGRGDPAPVPAPGPLMNPTLLAAFAYTYDTLGNRLTERRGLSPEGTVPLTFTYDPLSQLSFVRAPTTKASYTYDAVGNRTQVQQGSLSTSYTSNALNQYTTLSPAPGAPSQLTYDANGNLGTQSIVNSPQSIVYTYDSENRLLRATGTFGTASYTYDLFGRRLSKTVNGQTTTFLYDGDQLIGELKKNALTASYVYGPGIDEVLRMTRGRTSTYYHADGLGSIVVLTDSTGNMVERYTYDAFGMPQLAWPTPASLTQLSSVGNRFFFTGREYDQETGVYYYRARYYDPRIDRFTSRDPLGEAAGVNLYTYVDNNPVNFIDPFGLEKQCTPEKQCSQGWAECYTNCINTFAPGFPQLFVGSQIASNLPYELVIQPGSGGGLIVQEVPSAISVLYPKVWQAAAGVSKVVRPIQAVGFSYVAGASYGCMISCVTNTCNY